MRLDPKKMPRMKPIPRPEAEVIQELIRVQIDNNIAQYIADEFLDKVHEKTDALFCERCGTGTGQADPDVVRVVRCKDCKFMEWDCQDEDAIVCRRTNDGYWRGSDDYCSFGRRKEDG